MAVLAILLYLLAFVAGIGSLVCLVMVLIQMFKNGQTGLGIACIVLLFCGIGGLIAFVYGWIKNKEWNLQKVMLIWTVCLVAGILIQIVLIGVGAAVAGSATSQFQQQLNNMPVEELNVEVEQPSP